MPTAQTVQLGDVAEDITVGYVGPMAQQYVEDGIPFLRSLNVRPFRFDPTDLKFISPAFHRRIKKSALKPGDVVAVRTGNPGVSCVIPENLPDSNCSDLVVIKCGEKLDPAFVSYYINSVTHSHIKGQLVGAIQQHFNIGSAKEMRFPKLDKHEQHKRASVLSTLDAKIELNQRMNEELEGMAKLLYDYWFVQYDFPMSAAQAAALGKPHLTGHPYRASGGPMTYHETLKRGIPKGWEVGSLNCLGEIMGGSTPSTMEEENFTTQGTPWITPKDMSRNTGNKFISRGETDVSAEGIKNASLTLLPAGTVLMSSRAPIGYTAIARNPVTTNQGFKSFVPSKGYSTEFIYYTLNHQMKVIEQNASGSTFKEVSATTLKGIQTILPEASVRAEFAKVLKPILAQQDTLEQQTQELTTLRDWLLPMLMNGQVTVR